MARRIVTLLISAMVTVLVVGCVAVPDTADPGTPAEPTQGVYDLSGEAEAAFQLAWTTVFGPFERMPDPSAIVTIEAVQWSDSSLGCPEPGKFYSQVIVPGYKVVLSVDGQEYTVHTGNGNAVVCGPEGSPMAPEAGEGASPEETQEAMLISVREHLAGELEIDLDAVHVVSVEERMWRSSGLGCEKPGVNYLQVIVPGQLIILEAGGETYEYHTGNGNMVLCKSSSGEVE